MRSHHFCILSVICAAPHMSAPVGVSLAGLYLLISVVALYLEMRA